MEATERCASEAARRPGLDRAEPGGRAGLRAALRNRGRVTVPPVAKVRGRAKPGAPDADLRLAAKSVGVFVIKDGEATWVPAVDSTRIALMGELIGMVAATFATPAMVRRPPWPDLHGTVAVSK